MTIFRKYAIESLVVVVSVLVPLQTYAHEVSGCGGCGATYFHTCAQRFCDEVDSFPGWSQTFCQGCSGCSEDYYKSAADGGSENSWVDGTDIHFRNSHCTTAWDSYWGKTLSGIPCTDGVVTPGEVRDAWGDYDLEWIGLKCCSLLRDSSMAYWATAMDGLHLILGYKTSSWGATNFGRIWAQKMRQYTINFWMFTITIPSQTVTQAWFTATDQTQPNGTVARVLAETSGCYDDHLHGNGYVSPDPVSDSWYWYWDHSAGSPAYRAVNNLRAMYVYEILEPAVDEPYVKQIAAAFGFDTEPVLDLQDVFMMVNVDDPNSPRVLEVFKASGQYYYQDLGKLWRFDPKAGRYSPDRAEQRARGFLSEYKLLPSDAGPSDVEYDTLVEQSASGDKRTSLIQNTCAIYGREILGSQEQPVSVAGPGARLKVYIGPNGEIMGGMGNWRKVKQIGTVDTMTSEDAWSLFQKYGNRVAIAPVQAEWDQTNTDLKTATQGYYEREGRTFQSELIPCWIFQAEYYANKNLVTTADTYIPAAARYVPPVVTITSPEDGSTHAYGKSITFDCTLERGLGTAPFTYTWQSNVDGVLSSEKSFSTSLLNVNCSAEDCVPVPHRISVTVTDARGLQSTDAIELTVKGPCVECEARPCSCDLNIDGQMDLEDLQAVATILLDAGTPFIVPCE